MKDILRRIAERGMSVAHKINDDCGASYYVDGGELIDIFQHLLDEIERLP